MFAISTYSARLSLVYFLVLLTGLLHYSVSAAPLNATSDLLHGPTQSRALVNDGIFLFKRSELTPVEIAGKIEALVPVGTNIVKLGHAGFFDFTECKEHQAATKDFDGCMGLVISSKQGALIAHFNPVRDINNDFQYIATRTELNTISNKHKEKLAGGKGYIFAEALEGCGSPEGKEMVESQKKALQKIVVDMIAVEATVVQYRTVKPVKSIKSFEEQVEEEMAAAMSEASPDPEKTKEEKEAKGSILVINGGGGNQLSQVYVGGKLQKP